MTIVYTNSYNYVALAIFLKKKLFLLYYICLSGILKGASALQGLLSLLPVFPGIFHIKTPQKNILFFKQSWLYHNCNTELNLFSYINVSKGAIWQDLGRFGKTDNLLGKLVNSSLGHESTVLELNQSILSSWKIWP